jgi:hypothetical protein
VSGTLRVGVFVDLANSRWFDPGKEKRFEFSLVNIIRAAMESDVRCFDFFWIVE